MDGNLLQGSRIYSPTNPDLAWEKSAQTNFGIDLRALNSRLNFSLDYFIKDTEGLIIPDSPARSVGYYNVITSYSIHYTKLYDELESPV